MDRSNIRLNVFILFLAICQIIINNSTCIYVDCLGVVLVILLFNNIISFKSIILLSIVADLIGFWYLGSHLFATIIISFLTGSLVNFYNMSSQLQKRMIVCIFYAILVIITTFIGIITHNSFVNWLNLLVEIFIVCPVIQQIFILAKIKPQSVDIIY